MLLAHAILMLIAFGVLLPAGLLLARHKWLFVDEEQVPTQWFCTLPFTVQLIAHQLNSTAVCLHIPVQCLSNGTSAHALFQSSWCTTHSLR